MACLALPIVLNPQEKPILSSPRSSPIMITMACLALPIVLLQHSMVWAACMADVILLNLGKKPWQWDHKLFAYLGHTPLVFSYVTETPHCLHTYVYRWRIDMCTGECVCMCVYHVLAVLFSPPCDFLLHLVNFFSIIQWWGLALPRWCTVWWKRMHLEMGTQWWCVWIWLGNWIVK